MSLRAGPMLLCCACLAAAQSDLPREVQLLSRIRQHMKERLQEVPNYTCLQTIERSRRAAQSAKFKTVDKVRMEVADVKGKELFARPGQAFTESSPGAFARGGVMAGGLFALFANALFVSDSATLTYAGEEDVDGRKRVRYDFRVPLLRSGYKISSAYASAMVPYRGSFWADPETLDVSALRIVAEEIPPALRLQDAGIDIEYQQVRIGDSDALLPRRADLLLREVSGAQSRNVTIFSQCRQYGSDSVVSFQ